MEKIQFISTDPNSLASLISDNVRVQLEDLKRELHNSNAAEDLLTREQAAELLSINLSTLWAWTKQGKIKQYGISGARRYYKRTEIMEALQLKK